MNYAAHTPLSLEQLAGYTRTFTAEHPDVQAVALVSTDGLVLASSGLAPEAADQLAATTSGLTALALSGSVHFDLGDTTHVLVAYGSGTLLVSAVNDRCVMTALATSQSVGPTLYEMNRFAQAYGDSISPDVRRTLSALRRS